MVNQFTTGYGASDTHAVVMSDGKPNPHPSAGHPYNVVTLDDIFALVQNPPSVDKAQGQWIIPSSYNAPDARNHKVQLENGSFGALVLDNDQGNLSLQDVDAILSKVLGDVWYAIYSTRGSTPDNRKWRAFIPLAEALTGLEYTAYQSAFFDACQHAGMVVDRTLERPAQVAYLPNRGAFYEWLAEGPVLLNPKTHPMSKRAADYIAIAEEQDQAATVAANEGPRSWLRAFRAKHSIDELLTVYGFECHPYNPDLWRHPSQSSTHYGGVRIMRYADSDRWVSLSETVNAMGVGRHTGHGTRSGDAFDLYVHFSCEGNEKVATQYAKQCLAEEDRQRMGNATPEHGAQVWENIQKELAAEGLRRAEALQVERLDSEVGNNEDWDIEWPPGLTGEIAEHLYKGSSRPIKQFTIAAALYLMSVTGRKYNVFDQGLNMFIMLVAKTGRGKGVVKRGVDSLVQQVADYAQHPNLLLPFSHEVPVSEAGMRKALYEQNPICSYEEELGTTLLPTTRTNCSANDLALRKMATRLFDSGKNTVIGKKKASTDERTKEAVHQPTFTLAGDTQPHVFNALLGSGMEDTGFPSRMLPFFYYGERQYHNKDSANYKQLPEGILVRLKSLLEYVSNTGSVVVDIRWTKEALDANDAIDIEITDRINRKEPGTELLNRAQMIVARVAGLIAVGINHIDPIIDIVAYEYAKKIVMRGLLEMQRILASGGTGQGENVRLYRMREAIKAFLVTNPDTKIKTYKTPKAVVDQRGVINERYFLIKHKTDSDFMAMNGSRTTEQNIRETIAECLQQDILEEYSGIILDKRTRQKMYVIGSGY